MIWGQFSEHANKNFILCEYHPANLISSINLPDPEDCLMLPIEELKPRNAVIVEVYEYRTNIFIFRQHVRIVHLTSSLFNFTLVSIGEDEVEERTCNILLSAFKAS